MSGIVGLAYPVLAQILLTFVLLFATGRHRVGAIRAGRVRVPDIALDSRKWPDDVLKISNNMHNQFETPVLFYALCGLAAGLGIAGTLMIVLAWLFVASRLAHTYIHLTSNHVLKRFMAFVFGVLALLAMWVLIVFNLLVP